MHSHSLSPLSPSSPFSVPLSPLSPVQRPHSAPIHVVCNAPLLAPVPLPYHSPTFLQFDLPDIDQDLSRPPYVKPSRKRKCDSQDLLDAPQPKRHSASILPPASHLRQRHHRPPHHHHHHHHHHANPRSLQHQPCHAPLQV